MKSTRPPRPVGTDRQTQFAKSVWDMLWGGGLSFINSSTVKIDQTTRGLRFRSLARPGTAGAAASPALTWKGPWVLGTSYDKYDVVAVAEYPVMANHGTLDRIGSWYETIWFWSGDTSDATPYPNVLGGYNVAFDGDNLAAAVNNGGWVLLSVINQLWLQSNSTFNGQLTVKDSGGADRVLQIRSGLIISVDGNTSGTFP